MLFYRLYLLCQTNGQAFVPLRHPTLQLSFLQHWAQLRKFLDCFDISLPSLCSGIVYGFFQDPLPCCGISGQDAAREIDLRKMSSQVIQIEWDMHLGRSWKRFTCYNLFQMNPCSLLVVDQHSLNNHTKAAYLKCWYCSRWIDFWYIIHRIFARSETITGAQCSSQLWNHQLMESQIRRRM